MPSLNYVPESAALILDELQPTLLALPDATVATPRVTRDTALALTETMTGAYGPIAGRIGEVLHPDLAKARAEGLASLPNRVFAFYAADVYADKAFTPEVKRRRTELGAAVREHEASLTPWAQAVFRDDPEAQAELAAIARGRGYVDDADDVLRLCRLFTDRWDAVGALLPFEPSVLTQATADATALLAILKRAEGVDPARDLARRAYTYWASEYQALLALARFIHWDDPSAAARFPSLAEPRRTAPAPEAAPPAAPAPTPAPTEDAPTT